MRAKAPGVNDLADFPAAAQAAASSCGRMAVFAKADDAPVPADGLMDISTSYPGAAHLTSRYAVPAEKGFLHVVSLVSRNNTPTLLADDNSLA